MDLSRQELCNYIAQLSYHPNMDCSEIAQDISACIGGEIYTISSAINPICNLIRIPDDTERYVYHVIILITLMSDGQQYIVDGSVGKVYLKDEYLYRLQMLNPNIQLNIMVGDCSAFF